MNDSPNFAEFSVRQRREGKYLLRSAALIALYVAFGLVYFLFFTVGPIKVTPMIALLPLFEWMLVFFTWRFTDVEHEYTIASGTITFADIYASRTRKVKLEVRIRDMERIAPLSRAYEDHCRDADITLDFRGTKNTPDGYFFIFRDGGRKVAVLFEATARAVKLFRFYNPSATTASTSLRY